MRSLFVLTTAITLLLSAPAFAGVDPDRDVKLPTNAGLGPPVPFDPWTDENVQARYKFGQSGTFVSGVTRFGWGAGLGYAFDDFSNGGAEKIAEGCKSRYPGDGWSQIHCAAVAVKMTLKAIDYGPGGGDGPGLRSFCRDHVRALEEVFDELDLPLVDIRILPMDGHVATMITVVGDDSPLLREIVANGLDPNEYPFRMFLMGADEGTYKYVLDPGWDPGRVWPYNDNAIEFHDRNGDGKTDVKTLPRLPVLDPNRRSVSEHVTKSVLDVAGDIGAFVLGSNRVPLKNVFSNVATGYNVGRFEMTKTIPNDIHRIGAMGGPGAGGTAR